MKLSTNNYKICKICLIKVFLSKGRLISNERLISLRTTENEQRVKFSHEKNVIPHFLIMIFNHAKRFLKNANYKKKTPMWKRKSNIPNLKS